MGNKRILILAICAVAIFSSCRTKKILGLTSSCENELVSEFLIKEANLNVAINVHSCYDAARDTVEFIISISNNSKNDTNITSIYLPSIHFKINCYGQDTTSFLYPIVGGHPYRFDARAHNYDWPGLNAYFLKPKQSKIFKANLGKLQLCVLEYRVFSDETRNGYSLFVSRTEIGKTTISVLPYSLEN